MKTIGFIGDTHCGSYHGLWPLGRIAPDEPHTGPRYLMKCFEDLIERWPKLDLLVLMGDLIDGKQKKSDGTGLFTASLGEQTKGAIEVLEPLIAKATTVARVWGTPYHEDFHENLLALDEHFGIKYSQQVLDINLGGKILNVAHHPIGGTTLYQGTQTDKEAIWSSMATFTGKTPNARWIVRAHRHNFHMQVTPTRTVVINPCWELPTPHAKKQNYWRFQPDIGGLLMLADPEEDSGYRFRATLYDPPTPEVVTINATKQASTAKAVSPRRRGRRRR